MVADQDGLASGFLPYAWVHSYYHNVTSGFTSQQYKDENQNYTRQGLSPMISLLSALFSCQASSLSLR
jgi:uncharacterized OsmC-like protein